MEHNHKSIIKYLILFGVIIFGTGFYWLFLVDQKVGWYIVFVLIIIVGVQLIVDYKFKFSMTLGKGMKPIENEEKYKTLRQVMYAVGYFYILMGIILIYINYF